MRFILLALFVIVIPFNTLFAQNFDPVKTRAQIEEILNEESILGVWSGLLFQTESRYDSIVVHLAPTPMEASLFKNGRQKVFPLTTQGNSLSFKGDSGLRFDAMLSENEQLLHGILTNDLWVQSLNFKKTQDSWVSKIHKPEIIDTDYLVYLDFFKDASGKLQANIQSNKENRNLHFTIREVLLNGNEIDFKITNDRFKISAYYDTEKETVILNYGNAGGQRSIPLTKLQESDLEGYLPKVPGDEYRYQIPDTFDDSFETGSLAEVGIDTSMLEFMGEKMNEKYSHIHSIIITKDRKLVFEEYFHGYDREYLHDIRSAFKSFAALTLGKAMMQNNSLTVDQSITDYYPKYGISDPQKKAITLQHALTMSTGIKLEDEDDMQWNSNDWVAYKLNLPMVHKAGEQYQYSSGGSNLLSGVIEQATNQYLPLFMYQSILKPMGIQNFQMLTSPQSRGYLAGNFYLRPIDFTKFGLLVLDGGKWNGKQLIDESWIGESTTAHITGSHPKNSDYGYLWRLLEREVNGRPMKTIEAWGNGGQFLVIIPELDMTISFTSGNYNLFPEMEEKPFDILDNYILPAVTIKN